MLLTDVVMPGMNGAELVEQIQKIMPGIGVLFMSGYTENVIAHKGILDENIELIQKPLSPSILIDRVRGILA